MKSAGSYAKFLLLEFAAAQAGQLTVVVHLMQGGRLVPDTKRSLKPRNGLARWDLTDGPALLLTEAGKERKAGTWLVAGTPLGQPPMDRLGPEADAVSRDELGALLSAASGRIHGVLRDQHVVAGIGRRLANEICHHAQISPFAASNRLTSDQLDALHLAITETIAVSLAFERGNSEMASSAERPAAVHHREGSACPRCSDTIRTVEYRAYTVNYCATCQTGGKVLADNTTSMLLK